MQISIVGKVYFSRNYEVKEMNILKEATEHIIACTKKFIQSKIGVVKLK